MKKVLVITYYWPPSGGGGVQRWLKFTKYLPEFGWQPVIYTPENPQFEHNDHSLLSNIDPRIEVIKTPIREPYDLFKKFFLNSNQPLKQGVVNDKNSHSPISYLTSWVRGNMFIPDPRIAWVRPSIKFIGEVLEKEGIHTVVTTGPPHSLHLIGLGLKKKHNHIKWVADFRDPWTDWDILKKFHLTKKSQDIHQRMEREVVTYADKTIAVSESWARLFNSRYSKEIEVVTNGFDEDDLAGFDPGKNTDFRLLHAGLLNDLRNPPTLWVVLDRMLANNLDFKNNFKLVLAGNVSSAILEEIKTYHHLKNHLVYLGYLDHQQLIKEYQKASVLLLIQNKSNMANGHLPGKFFEYLGTGIPVLALGQKESDLSKLIGDYNPLPLCDPENDSAIKACITESFEVFRRQEKLTAPRSPKIFSRKELTKKLASILDEL